MPQNNKNTVTVIPAAEAGAAIIDSGKSLTFQDVHFVSLVNDETYGIPAITSDDRYKQDGLPLRVLYINPRNVAAFFTERIA